MTPKQIIASFLAVAVLGLVVAYYMQKNLKMPTIGTKPAVTSVATTTKPAPNIPKEPPMVAKYIMENIGNVSPIKPTTGQVFRVTKMQISKATGTVEYGDTLKNYAAKFSYTVDPAGKITISNFMTAIKK